MLKSVMTDAQRLAAHWNAFCDDGPVPTCFKSWNAFINQMFKARLVRLRVADGEGAAINRPVEWALTEAGQAAFDKTHAEQT